MSQKRMYQILQESRNRFLEAEIRHCQSCKQLGPFCEVHGTLDRYNKYDCQLDEAKAFLKNRPLMEQREY